MKVWNIYQFCKQDEPLLDFLKISAEEMPEIPVEIDFLQFSGSQEIYICGICYNGINIKSFLSSQSIQYFYNLVEKELENERT